MRDNFETGAPAPDQFRIGGRHVLVALVAFFGVVFAVNGYMLVRALATHSGVVAVEPYRRGLAYNERIQANDRQIGLGWRDTAEFTGLESLAIILMDRDGRPVSGLALSGRLGRPSTSIDDKRLEFREERSGRYVASTGRLEAGSWLISLDVRRGGDAHEPIYRAKRRLWLTP